MNIFHYYFFILKVVVVIGLILMYTGIIKFNRPLFLITDTLYKFSLGLYLIYFFTNKNNFSNMNNHDRLLFIISGFILILTINYEEIYKMVTGYEENKPECNNNIEVVSKPCPPCSDKEIIHGKIMSKY